MSEDQFDNTPGNYRLKRLLGNGGYAKVYLGEHVKLQTWAAIKMLRKEYARDAEKIAEFYQEARRTAQLRHRYIVRIFECDNVGDHHFFVMDYAPDGSLRQFCRPDNLLSHEDVSKYIKQTAEALQFMHDEGFIHRDVKPENILISHRRNIWLCDLGIAVATHGKPYVLLRDIRGTSGFVAPEQYGHRLYPASDQYALAVVAYELLVGDGPFHGTPAQIREQHQHLRPPSLRAISPAIPPAVERVVMKALSKDPRMRYPSIMAFANALERAFASSSSAHVDNEGFLRPMPVRQQFPRMASLLVMGEQEQLYMMSKQSEPLPGQYQSSDTISRRPYSVQSEQSVQLVRRSKVPQRKQAIRSLNSIERVAFCITYSVIAFIIGMALLYIGVGLILSLLVALALFLILQVLLLLKR